MTRLPQVRATTTTLRLFYLLKLCILIFYGWELLVTTPLEGASWLWPVQGLAYFSHPEWILKGLVFACGGFGLGALYRPFSLPLKIGEALAFFLFLASYYSFGKIDHGVHGVVLATWFIALIGQQDNGPKEITPGNNLLLRSAIGIFLFTYFLSGLWKLRFAVESVLSTHSLDSVSKTLGHQLAVNIMSGGPETSLAFWLMGLNEFWQLLLWVGVISGELLMLLIAFKPRFYFIGGIFLITFHQLIYFSMGISFVEAQLLALILMVLGPYRLKSVKA